MKITVYRLDTGGQDAGEFLCMASSNSSVVQGLIADGHTAVDGANDRYTKYDYTTNQVVPDTARIQEKEDYKQRRLDLLNRSITRYAEIIADRDSFPGGGGNPIRGLPELNEIVNKLIDYLEKP